MIDFSKLLGRTKEEADLAWNKRADDFNKEMESGVAERSQLIEDVYRTQEKLTPWESQFVASLKHKAQMMDPVSGFVGGCLMDLSSEQMKTLKGIADRRVFERQR